MSVENRGLVLVAEDEKPIADLIGMYLRRDGFGVHAVATGPDALAAARRLHPVAVILDVGLPGIDGTEVCRTLRAEGDSGPDPVLHRPRRRDRPRARPGDGR